MEIVTVPFFHPRGTAFSSLNRTRVLGNLGHRIDILTYPIGEDIDLPNTTIHRTWNPGVHALKMGPSLPKLILDILLTFKTVSMLLHHRYDLLHVHEEAAYWCALLKGVFRLPTLYDMHSSLAEQLSNFGFTDNRLLAWLVRRYERWVLHRSDAMIVICQNLYEYACRVVPQERVFLIENVPTAEETATPDPQQLARLREELKLGPGPLVVYTGTFGKNQGLEVLVETIPHVAARFPDVVYLLVGGVEADLARVQAYVDESGLGAHVRIMGQHPVEHMPSFMALADVLVSPRLAGTNTPLKIYAYLASGKPIVATDSLTHTQTLDHNTAMLVSPDVAGLAEGISRVLSDPELAAKLAANGRDLIEREYSFATFAAKTAAVYEYLTGKKKETD